MQKLKTIFLLTSLILLLISCGKENQTEDTFNPNQKELNHYDYDGDLIPNHEDPRPFVADLPTSTIKAKLKFKNHSFELKSSNADIKPLVTYLAHNLRKENLHYKFNSNLSTVNIPAFTAYSIPIELELSKNHKLENLDLELKANDEIVMSGLNRAEESLVSLISKNQIVGKHLSLNFKSYSFRRGEKLITAEELQESLKQNTYELTIIQMNNIKSYQIAKNLTLKEAFQVLDLPGSLFSEIFEQPSDIQKSDLQLLKDTSLNWFVLNKKDKIKAGDKIVLAQISAKDLKEVPGKTAIESQNFFQPNFQIDLSRLKNISIKLDGEFQYLEPYHIKSIAYRRNAIQSYRSKFAECEVTDYYVHHKSHSFNLSSVDQFFDAFIDGQKITLSQYLSYGVLHFQNLKNKNLLEIRLKNSYNPGNVQTGTKRGTHTSCHVYNYRDKELTKRIHFGLTNQKGLQNIRVNLQLEKELLIH